MRLTHKYERVFTPSAPVRSRHLFMGRAQEEADLLADLRRPGVHPIITGERGVGKTTLARLAISPKNGRVMVGCGQNTNFSDLARAILHELGLSTDEVESTSVTATHHKEALAGPVSVSSEGIERHASRSIGLGQRELTPWILYQHIRDHKQKLAIILDEYDLIPKRNKRCHDGVAELIKHLADHSEDCDSRIVIVGVARSAEALLGHHESIARSGDEIYVRPLRRKDIVDFLATAERDTGITFVAPVKQSIVLEANGYPYYVHLIGLLSVEAMLAQDRHLRVVSETHYSIAQRRAWMRSVRSVLGRHRRTLQGLTHEQVSVIRALVSHSAGVQKRTALQEECARDYQLDPERFKALLVTLIEDKRLLHWKENDGTVRFTDPLLPLFLRGWWFPLKKVPIDDRAAEKQLDLFDGEE